MNRSARFILVAMLTALLIAACGGGDKPKMDPIDKVLMAYEAAVRWNEFDEAAEFVDPLVRIEKPLSDLERERFKQIQVTSYEVKRKHIGDDGTVEQVVEIRLIGRNTQIERMVTDHQKWRWDPEAKTLWLVTGLPDFTPQ
jgi:hypothetical protein